MSRTGRGGLSSSPRDQEGRVALCLDNKAAWPPLLAPNSFLDCPLIFLWKLGLAFLLQSMCGLTLILAFFLLASFLPIHSCLVVRYMVESSSQRRVLGLELVEDTVALGLLDSSKVLFGRQLFHFQQTWSQQVFPGISPPLGAPVGLGQAGRIGLAHSPAPLLPDSVLNRRRAALISGPVPALLLGIISPSQGLPL